MQSGGAGVPQPLGPGEQPPETTDEGVTVADVPLLVKTLRVAEGLSQKDLGERIGYPAPVVGNIEQGSRKLGLKTLGDIAAALGYEVRIQLVKKP